MITAPRELLHDAIRCTLARHDKPLRTTELVTAVGDPETSYPDIYRALIVLEHAGELTRAGRVGPSAAAEVLWELSWRQLWNPAFADLLAELEGIDHGA